VTASTDQPAGGDGRAPIDLDNRVPSSPSGVVESADGTPIAWQESGGRRQVLLVHSFPDASMWRLVMPHLPDDVGAVWMDRRGRGGSGRGEDYADFSAEVDDVLAVAALLEPDAVLVGHSIGAVIALETLRRDTTPFAGAVLYEPPLPIDDSPTPGRSEMLTALDEGRHEDAVEAWARRSVRLPAPAVEAFKVSPAWPRAVEAIWTMRREGEALRGLHGDDHRYAHVAIPVRLLLGTETPPHHVDAIRRLERQLPNSRTVMLEGHGHSAHLTAPELVAAAVVELTRELESSR
jgi:pimeloyl-ACP methyl ester carboxylesterase